MAGVAMGIPKTGTFWSWTEIQELLNLEAERCAQVCDELARFPFDRDAKASTAESSRHVLTVAAQIIRKRKETREGIDA